MLSFPFPILSKHNSTSLLYSSSSKPSFFSLYELTSKKGLNSPFVLSDTVIFLLTIKTPIIFRLINNHIPPQFTLVKFMLYLK